MIWLSFGKLMQKITNPIIFFLLYFLVITPIGMIMRIFKKDLLNLAINKEAKTYWINSETSMTQFKDQF